MTTTILGPQAPPVLPPGVGPPLLETPNPDNPGGTGSVGVLAADNLGAGARVGAGLGELRTEVQLRTLLGVNGIAITQQAETITIDGAGAGGSPAAPDTSVQFNDGGAFGGNANVTIDDASGVLTSGVAVTTPQVRIADDEAVAFSIDELTSGDRWCTIRTAVGPSMTVGLSSLSFLSLGNGATLRLPAGTSFIVQNATPATVLQLDLSTDTITVGTTADPLTGEFHMPLTGLWRVRDAAAHVWLELDSSQNEILLANGTDNPDIFINTGGAIDIGNAGSSIGVLGASPVVQQTALGTTAGFTAGVGTGVNDDSTFDGGVGGAAYTIGDVVRILKLYGWFA